MAKRGRDTRFGEAGRCDHCGATMPEGPDACIGLLPGVIEACCGHGIVADAYVTLVSGVVLRGVEARLFMRQPSWPLR